VKAICRTDALFASKILWPRTPDQRSFPLIFFFDTESGYRDWYHFLDDVGIAHGWNPRGWYKQIQQHRFTRFGGAQGYLDFIRREGHFLPEATE
jgi:hypothetical protein